MGGGGRGGGGGGEVERQGVLWFGREAIEQAGGRACCCPNPGLIPCCLRRTKEAQRLQLVYVAACRRQWRRQTCQIQTHALGLLHAACMRTGGWCNAQQLLYSGAARQKRRGGEEATHAISGPVRL